METGAAHRERFRQATRDALACLSLANLYCLNLWLEAGNTGFDYYRRLRPTATIVLSIVVLVLLGGTAFWAAVQAWRRWAGPWARWLAVAGIAFALLVPFQILRRHVLAGILDSLDDAVGSGLTRIALALAGTGFVVWLAARTERVAHHLASVLILLLPLAPILAIQSAIVQARRLPPTAYSGVVRDVEENPVRTRLLVMVFDEWDQRLTFERRPARIALPRIDQLRAQAFAATRVIGGGYLGVTNSIGSILTGERLRSVEPRSVGVELDGSRLLRTDPAAAWADRATIFSRLQSLGISSSIVGWYVPYCRLLSEWVNSCSWEPGASIYARREMLQDLSLAEQVSALARRQVHLFPLADELQLDGTEDERRELLSEEFARLERQFDASVGDSEVVYVHWPIPHPLGLPNAAPAADTPANYFDNLVAMDALLGRIEQRLRQRKEWDDVTLILTSDHSLRPGYWDDTEAWTDEEEQATAGGRRSPYVPFIVKFPGAHPPMEFDQPFSVVLTHDVVLAIAQGEVSSPAELAAWLSRHRNKHPTDIVE
jgi:hypothetical protein